MTIANMPKMVLAWKQVGSQAGPQRNTPVLARTVNAEEAHSSTLVCAGPRDYGQILPRRGRGLAAYLGPDRAPGRYVTRRGLRPACALGRITLVFDFRGDELEKLARES